MNFVQAYDLFSLCFLLYKMVIECYMFAFSGADVARYCSSQFHDELAKDEDYDNNLQKAMITVFSRYFPYD